MSISTRQEKIIDILNERNYITVQDLAEMMFTSPSSIRRDLTYLQNNGLVQRSHGGVTLPNPLKGVASFYDRSHKNVKEKRIIAKKTSVLLKKGQSILLDGSSTSVFLLPYIAKLDSVTVFTNNLSTALNAIELGIDTHCIGGHSINHSAVLSGSEAYRALQNMNVDILFFSSQSLSANGYISDSTEEENYVRQLMMRTAKTKVFLCDHEKFNTTSLYKFGTLNDIDYAVFDDKFEELDITNTSTTFLI